MSGYRFPAPLETRWSPNCEENPTLQARLSCQDMCPKKPRCLQCFITCSPEQFIGSQSSSQEYWETADANTYTHREICRPVTLAPVNIGLSEHRGRSCFQAGLTWDKNRLFLHRQSQIWCNLIQQSFGTELGVFNNAYMVLCSQIQGQKKG